MGNEAMARTQGWLARTAAALVLGIGALTTVASSASAAGVVIDAVAPAVARAGGTTVFTILGTGFSPASVVTVEPDGVVQSVAFVSATQLTATVSFPANARTGTRDVRVATGADDWLETDVVVVRPTEGEYHALTPARLLDTRDPGRTKPGPTSITDLTVVGVGGVPATGVSAVVLNVTATEATATTFVTAYPAGNPRPVASNLNVVAGQTVPNLVTVAVGAGGGVSLYNHQGSVHLVVDVAGWYGAAGAAAGAAFVPAGPRRLLDTRTAGTPVGPGGVVAVEVGGGTPLAAAALNVTVTEPTAASFLTVYPSDATRPLASNLNMRAGQTVANMVIARVGPDGKVLVYNHTGATHVVVDLLGIYDESTLPVFGGQFTGQVPTRALDTRVAGDATGGQPLGQGQTLQLPLAGRAGVPPTANAVVVNVTATEPTAGSFLTVWASDEDRPLASNLNVERGLTVPNLVVVPLSVEGTLSVYNHGGTSHVIVDVVGWYR